MITLTSRALEKVKEIQSAESLQGQGLHGAGFKFNNPTAKSTCGCGSSFSV